MILLIILDGATFKLIEPWVWEGNLPVFEKLMKNGVHGELKSTVPPTTCPAIPAFYTGKNPGKLGLFGYTKEDGTLVNSTDVKGIPVWKLLTEKGFRTCVINLPATYPPEKINGVMITGVFTPSKDVVYTYPPDLQYKIGDYPIAIEWEALGLGKYYMRKNEILQRQTEITERRFATLKKLLRESEYDLSIFFVKGTDILQHFFWDDKAILKKYYQGIDHLTGRLLNSYRIESVFIISDHGFDPAPTHYFNIDSWLESNGYIKLKGGSLRKGIVSKSLPLRRLIPKSIKKTLVKISTSLSSERKTEKFILGVNWNETVAHMEREYGIKVTNTVPKEKREKLKAEIIEKLKQMRNKEGEKIIREATRREEIYSGEYLEKLPDIIFLTSWRYQPIGGLNKHIFTEIPAKKRSKISGSHDFSRNGIFIVYGPNIKEDVKIEGAGIVDVAPTILHMMGVPIPADMDGRVLKEIFKEGTDPAVRAVTYQKRKPEIARERMVWSKEDEERVKERLRKLGYLD